MVLIASAPRRRRADFGRGRVQSRRNRSKNQQSARAQLTAKSLFEGLLH